MNPTAETNPLYGRIITRKSFLLIQKAALESQSFRFARQASLSWLAAFGGDLEVNLIMARALLGEGKVDQAAAAVEKLVRLDPEFGDAWKTLADIYEGRNPEKYHNAAAVLNGLGHASPRGLTAPDWSATLCSARMALKNHFHEEAEKFIYPVIGMNLEHALPAVTHLRIIVARQDLAAVHQLARLYHARWPECLQFALCLADAQIQNGQESAAVSLLHQVVSNDTAAQVPVRLWGEEFRYRALWPSRLEIDFSIPIPADVAFRLGWNKLPAGTPVVRAETVETAVIPEPDITQIAEAAAEELNRVATETDIPETVPVSVQVAETAPVPCAPAIDPEPDQTQPVATEKPVEVPAAVQAAVEETVKVELKAKTVPAGDAKKDKTQPRATVRRAAHGIADNLRSVEQAFGRLAGKLNRPGITREDGRFPIYVIFSTHGGLVKQYGLQTALVVENEMKHLAEAVQKRPGWGAMVFLPDEMDSAARSGIEKLQAIDPWQLKLAVNDLDQTLSKKGSMIGAVLIIGGNEIVPFHKLPNPTDDSDEEVASDNPYATLDSNYFVPEWPVGRLPGEAGPDASLMLDQLRRQVRYHAQFTSSIGWWKRALGWLDWIERFKNLPYMKTVLKKVVKNSKTFPSFGYSAAAWRRSSIATFRPVGDPRAVLVSPPEYSGSFDPRKITNSALSYYNLHGLPDTAEWYGQRDLSVNPGGQDYPVALSAKDLVKNGHAPNVVYSEACYGAHLDGKAEADSIALRFLSLGTSTFIASTGIAYGSVNVPLIGADLLGYLFWKNYSSGMLVGEAFVKAKLELVREMTKRQGSLDGEDQKTLLSFVMYGDPLITGSLSGAKSKHLPRLRIHPDVNTSQTIDDVNGSPRGITKEMLVEVKRAVEAYLPGLDDAEVSIQHETKHEPDYANASGSVQKFPYAATGRLVVTISKKVQSAEHVHRHFARATLDTQGKVVKLAVSR